MSVLHKLASALERSDEVPNQILAKEIADANDTAAVQELAANLANANKDIQSDCIKVLYEVGYLKPDLIADYVDTFVGLLRSRNNRLVWGGMTALGAVADRKAADIWKHIEAIIQTTDQGSVITQDWGVRVLAAVSAHSRDYEKRIFPFLKAFLEKCPPKDLPRHAESMRIAVHMGNQAAVLSVLEQRLPTLKAAPAKRLQQVIRKIHAL